MDYKKKYNKYKSKYLNIKKILGGSDNSMPSMPEDELYKPNQLSPLRLQEPHSLSTSNMMYIPPTRDYSESPGRSGSPPRGSYGSPQTSRSRSPSIDSYGSPQRDRSGSPPVISPRTRALLGDMSVAPLDSPFTGIVSQGVPSPDPLDIEGLSDLSDLEEEQDLLNIAEMSEKQPRRSQRQRLSGSLELRRTKSHDSLPSKSQKRQKYPKDGNISKLISEELKEHPYFKKIHNKRTNKIKYIDYHYGWRIRWHEATEDDPYFRPSENYDTLDKAIIRLYELIDSGKISLK